jgi:hypothetical protein
MKYLLLVLLVACGGGNASSGSDGGLTDAPAPGDGASCGTVIVFTPSDPVADPAAPIRAQAQVFDSAGITDYQWFVMYNGGDVAWTYEAQDHSQIDFVAANPGTYYVRVVITGPTQCPEADAALPVSSGTGQFVDYRMRVYPPAGTGAPPQERVIHVEAGTNTPADFTLDPGQVFSGTVKNGATGVPAYLRFMPAASPKGYVETFSAANGGYSTRLLAQGHQVLVIPMAPGLAPALLPWDLSTTTLTVDAGNAVTGTVKDGAGAALAGAQVQLTSGGVPSSLATTAADGSFTVRTSFAPSATVDVAVTPPAGKGLPVLAATGSFGSSIAIQYANAATCNLGSTPVKRGATTEPGARVTVVGTIASAGTIGGGTAAGTVRIAATADGTAHLPSMLVPRAALSAVVDLGQGDLVVAALDTQACAAQTIDAPARAIATGTAVTTGGTPITSVAIEALPIGALALAGTPPVVTTADGSGAFSLALASGGRYDITFVDPLGNSAPLVVDAANAADVPVTAMLPKALRVSGKLGVYNSPNPVVGASVQMLCLSCGAATPPVAEAATNQISSFALGIPDPGM